MGYKHPKSKPEVAPKPTKCAGCGAKASAKCAGCEDSPEYQPGDSRDVFYCSKVCQKKHWPTHKGHCKAMQQRKKLLRCAQLLKEALLAFREVLFDLHLTDITFRNGTLNLNRKALRNIDRSKRFPFPDHLTSNFQQKEAALTHNQCTAAMALLGPLTKKLLKEVCSKVQVADVDMKAPPFRTQLVPGADIEDSPHTVLVVRLPKGEEKWVIDTTGSQYGFREVIVPYKKYLTEQASRLATPLTVYDAGVTKDLDEFVLDPKLTFHQQQRANLAADRRTREHFALFIDTCVVDDFLNGSDDDMKTKSEVFIRDLKVHLRKFPG